MLGIHVGSLVHVGAAAFGLSALLVSSATAFSVVKYLGAGYLVWLGIGRLRSRDEPDRPHVRPRDDLGRVFRQGIVVNVLNPKTALFFFAFLPQFVRPGDGPVVVQVLLLGLLFITLGMMSDGLYAVLAAKAATWLRSNRRWPRVERRVSGGILITLGATAALAGRPATAD
jgi:threonine/homoserine/homoserine lactone efflux protein